MTEKLAPVATPWPFLAVIQNRNFRLLTPQLRKWLDIRSDWRVAGIGSAVIHGELRGGHANETTAAATFIFDCEGGTYWRWRPLPSRVDLV